MVSKISTSEASELLQLMGYEGIPEEDCTPEEELELECFAIDDDFDLFRDYEKVDPTCDNVDSLIQLDDIALVYGDKIVIDDFDLSICEGDCIAFMGPNGSGKTSLLEIIAGVKFPQGGSYYFRDALINRESMEIKGIYRNLHQRVGILYQDASTQLGCDTVEEEISFAPKMLGLSPEEVLQQVDHVCEILNIDHLRSYNPKVLSSGEQKRVAIAAIMTLDPEVFCFDEPFYGIDLTTQAWMSDFMDYLRGRGKTILIATHDIDVANKYADYIVAMGEKAKKLSTWQ